jgi:hypothetical protein
MRGTAAAQEADVPGYPDRSPAEEVLELHRQPTDRVGEVALCPVGADVVRRPLPRCEGDITAAVSSTRGLSLRIGRHSYRRITMSIMAATTAKRIVRVVR